MNAKRMYNLGAIPATKTDYKKEEKLIEIEKYLRYEKRYSESNVTRTMGRFKYILYTYEVSQPCQEDAIRPLIFF